jgi:hypothetical protein
MTNLLTDNIVGELSIDEKVNTDREDEDGGETEARSEDDNADSKQKDRRDKIVDKE